MNIDQYQTVYADTKGSIAAPTAGLHFTDDLNYKLIKKGIHIEDTILHVGRGTFMPVTTEDFTNHKMHSEQIIFTNKNSENLNKHYHSGKKITAVGTTSVRLLESCYNNGEFSPFNGETDIFIYPGKYKWKVVDKLITNFHLPRVHHIKLHLLEHKGVKNPVKKSFRYMKAIKENIDFNVYSLASLQNFGTSNYWNRFGFICI